MKRLVSLYVLALTTVYVNAQCIKVCTDGFQRIWNQSLQIPIESRWMLHAKDIGRVSRDPSWKFRSDLPKMWMQASHDDYTHSGYDRGHILSALDKSFARYAMKTTFVMSNICPQVPSFNRGVWKQTENLERWLAIRHDSCRILVRPFFFEKDTVRIGKARIAVPHAYLKIIYNVNPDTIYKVYFLWNK